MLKHVCALCRHTQGRFERTHGDVLNGHTGGVFIGATQDTKHHTETDRDRERQQREKRRRKRRRQDKRQELREERRVKREKIHFQYGGAWPFFVDAVICLVSPVCARDLSLLNSVQ